MIHIISSLLIMFFSSAEEVYFELNPSTMDKCDIGIVRGVENQISKALCMESLDISCLTEHQKKKLIMPTPNYDTSAMGDKISTLADAINSLSDPKYHISKNKKIIDSWLNTVGNNPKRGQCRPSPYFPSQKEIGEWQVNPADLIEGTLGWVPFLGNLISSVKNLMNSMSFVDLKKDEPETTCNWSAIHVSTVKEGSDCVPYYNAESPAVRHFLRQSDSKTAAPKK